MSTRIVCKDGLTYFDSIEKAKNNQSRKNMVHGQSTPEFAPPLRTPSFMSMSSEEACPSHPPFLRTSPFIQSGQSLAHPLSISFNCSHVGACTILQCLSSSSGHLTIPSCLWSRRHLCAHGGLTKGFPRRTLSETAVEETETENVARKVATTMVIAVLYMIMMLLYYCIYCSATVCGGLQYPPPGIPGSGDFSSLLRPPFRLYRSCLVTQYV